MSDQIIIASQSQHPHIIILILAQFILLLFSSPNRIDEIELLRDFFLLKLIEIVVPYDFTDPIEDTLRLIDDLILLHLLFLHFFH